MAIFNKFGDRVYFCGCKVLEYEGIVLCDKHMNQIIAEDSASMGIGVV